MVMTRLLPIGLCLGLSVASPCLAKGWSVEDASPTANARLRFTGDGPVSYLFECTRADIVLTEFGVTDLLDLQTNTKVGDQPGSTMLPGAALMALSTEKTGSPALMPSADGI